MKFKSDPYKQLTVKLAKDKPTKLIKFNDKGEFDTDDKAIAAALEKVSTVKTATSNTKQG